MSHQSCHMSRVELGGQRGSFVKRWVPSPPLWVGTLSRIGHDDCFSIQQLCGCGCTHSKNLIEDKKYCAGHDTSCDPSGLSPSVGSVGSAHLRSARSPQ